MTTIYTVQEFFIGLYHKIAPPPQKILNPELKDWQICKMINLEANKENCKQIKELRKHGRLEYLCRGCYLMFDTRLTDWCGIFIPIECLVNSAPNGGIKN